MANFGQESTFLINAEKIIEKKGKLPSPSYKSIPSLDILLDEVYKIVVGNFKSFIFFLKISHLKVISLLIIFVASGSTWINPCVYRIVNYL